MPPQKKRKLSTDSNLKDSKASGQSHELQNSADVFRKFFESRFQPLDGVTSNTVTAAQRSSDDSNEDGQSEEDFEGFSEDEEIVPEVKVVEYTDTGNEDTLLDKKTRKALLSSKISSLSGSSNIGSKRAAPQKNEESDEEADNLKNDLALQRLLKESHLLESASDLNPTGKNRHKAIDLRLQALGAKKSIYEQHKMPKALRIGIQAKAAKREETRRREARENGIILEKPAVSSKQKTGGPKRRERGVGAPAVGKFSGGTLKLSKRDLASIRGSSAKGSKGSKRGRR